MEKKKLIPTDEERRYLLECAACWEAIAVEVNANRGAIFLCHAAARSSRCMIQEDALVLETRGDTPNGVAVWRTIRVSIDTVSRASLAILGLER